MKDPYTPPKTLGVAESLSGGVGEALIRRYLTAAAVLTAIAATLCVFSSARVQELLPEYPRRYNLAPYQPLAAVRVFHSLGVTALIALLVGGGVWTAIARHSSRKTLAFLFKLFAGLHLTYLGVAIAAFTFCLWRLSRVFAGLL